MSTAAPPRDDAPPADSGERAARPVAKPGMVLVPVVLMLGAALVYGPTTGFVYSEFSDFALYFGHHGWYQALGPTDILSKYLGISQGWYRPTSFYLAPYVLRLDYFEPGGVIAANIAFFVLAAWCVVGFVRDAPVGAALFATTTVLFAPALYLEPYGAQIDSLYILFGAGFMASLLSARRSVGRRRAGWWALAVVSFAFAVTSKEIAIVFAPLAVPVLLLAEPRWSWAGVGRALRIAAPFIAASVLFGVLYLLSNPSSTGPYAAKPSPERLPGAVSLVTWSFGLRSPVNNLQNWVPPWGSGQFAVALLVVATIAATVALAWREIRLWRLLVFAAAFLGLAVAIAIPGGLPYHAYPMIVLLAAGVLVAARAATATLRRRSPALARAYVAALGAVAVIQIGQAHSTYGSVLYSGPQSVFLKASSEVFDGSLLAPVRSADNPLFIFQDCLSALHNPLRYYARAGDGEEIVVQSFDPRAHLAQAAAANRQSRETFAAVCTGTADPWYRLERYDPRRRAFVPVG